MKNNRLQHFFCVCFGGEIDWQHAGLSGTVPYRAAAGVSDIKREGER